MNLPARIASGERLYQDVQSLYGPFAATVNACLFRVFGVRLGVLHFAGAICAVIVLLLIYKIARRMMNVQEAFVAAFARSRSLRDQVNIELHFAVRVRSALCAGDGAGLARILDSILA